MKLNHFISTFFSTDLSTEFIIPSSQDFKAFIGKSPTVRSLSQGSEFITGRKRKINIV